MARKKPTLTAELAEALGYRDRCNGVDWLPRAETQWRHNIEGNPKLTQAYRRGWIAAGDYIDRHFDWGRRTGFRELREAVGTVLN